MTSSLVAHHVRAEHQGTDAGKSCYVVGAEGPEQEDSRIEEWCLERHENLDKENGGDPKQPEAHQYVGEPSSHAVLPLPGSPVFGQRGAGDVTACRQPPKMRR